MQLQATNCCLVDCTQWTQFDNQNSLNGDSRDAYRTVPSCQDYCITVSTCVAVDFNFNDNSCWLHTSLSDLWENNTYSQDRTNQYRLDRICPTV